MLIDHQPHSRWRVLLILALLPALGSGLPALAQPEAPASEDRAASDWNQFRGPDRAGISSLTGLRRSWPEEGPTVLWRRPLGQGFSAISVAGDFLYTLFAIDDDEFAGCFRVADGSDVWKVRIGDKYQDEWGDGPRATPTIDGETVYVLSTFGNLFALDTATGEIRWQVQLGERYGHMFSQYTMSRYVPDDETAPNTEFDHSSSPLVAGDLLYVYTGAGNGQSMVALDKATGETRWTALDSKGSYSSPMLVTFGGQQQLLMIIPDKIVALTLDGELLWEAPWAPATFTQGVPVAPDRLFASTTFDWGAKVLSIEKTSAEEFKIETQWEYRLMRNAWQSSVFYEGSIYGFDNATLNCLDAETGELRWRQRGLGRGTLVIADGLLIVLSDKGLLTLSEVSSEKYTETGRVQILTGQTLSRPTPAQGRLFLRNHEEMVCVDLVN